MTNFKVDDPDFLYKARSYNKETLEDKKLKEQLRTELKSAVRGKFWFSSVTKQNDPFESAPVIAPFDDKVFDELVSIHKILFGKNASMAFPTYFLDFPREHRTSVRNAYWDDARQAMKSGEYFASNRQRISCFSNRIDNPVMWGTYSVSGSAFAYQLKRRTGERGVLKPWEVIYQKNRPNLQPIHYLKQYILNKAKTSNIKLSQYQKSTLELTRAEGREVTLAQFAVKSDEWKHEAEWRFIDIVPEDGYVKIDTYELVGIVFGASASRELEEFVRSHVPERIRFKKMALDPKEYRLNLTDITDD